MLLYTYRIKTGTVEIELKICRAYVHDSAPIIKIKVVHNHIYVKTWNKIVWVKSKKTTFKTDNFLSFSNTLARSGLNGPDRLCTVSEAKLWLFTLLALFLTLLLVHTWTQRSLYARGSSWLALILEVSRPTWEISMASYCGEHQVLFWLRRAQNFYFYFVFVFLFILFFSFILNFFFLLRIVTSPRLWNEYYPVRINESWQGYELQS